jgi:hypothetical protein
VTEAGAKGRPDAPGGILEQAQRCGETLARSVSAIAPQSRRAEGRASSVADAPGGCLRVGEIKVSEQGVVREVPQPAGVIRHGVESARDIMVACMVAVRALEERVQAEEVRAGGGRGRSAFGGPCEGGAVVAMDPESALLHVPDRRQ